MGLDKAISEDAGKWPLEEELFRQAVAQQRAQLDRNPTDEQLRKMWQRWKREHGLEQSEEADKSTGLWTAKK